jgi:hypothetical protein
MSIAYRRIGAHAAGMWVIFTEIETGGAITDDFGDLCAVNAGKAHAAGWWLYEVEFYA